MKRLLRRGASWTQRRWREQRGCWMVIGDDLDWEVELAEMKRKIEEGRKEGRKGRKLMKYALLGEIICC